MTPKYRLARLALALGFGAASLTAQTNAVRVLIVSSKPAPFLRQILQDTGRFDVRVSESPMGLTAETLAPFDVVVGEEPAWDAATSRTVRDFVRAGKGFVTVHSSSVTNNDSAVHFFQVEMADTSNPIVQGMKRNFKIADKLTQGAALLPGAEVLAKAEDQPVLFTANDGAGRIFDTELGHGLAAMNEPLFMTTFARGTEWAATGKVTLPAEIGLVQPATNAVRALLITGGHEHETAFYSLFNGYNDLAWTPVSTSATAFQEDLRKYDVLILYDFTRDVDDKAKQNLRNFVESGKGVLVLHHAILSYEKWPWWAEKVVGGRYLLAPEKGLPASTYKGGCEFFVTPAGAHPITDGIGPFHLWDECYKGMWVAPDVKPLLLTDNPNSDHCIAWVSPYEQSRVVFIQLGHGHTAFRHPAYRALVHNAILWVAGRPIPSP